MFIVYQSNKLDTLLLKAYSVIEKKPLANIFEKEIFIHDNRTLFQYLNIFIANQKGISSNLAFYHPHDFIWKLFEKILYKKQTKNIFTQSVMTWKIMKILDKKENYEHIDIKKNNMTKFKFSFLMAHMFEQYLIYRPDWIHSWENKEDVSRINQLDQWQVKLWKEVQEDYRNTHPSKNHFVTLFYKFQLLISQNKIKKRDFPSRFFIISSLHFNPFYIKIFKKISTYCTIYFLHITPFKKNVLQNSLMKIWGKYELLHKKYISNSKLIKTINSFKQNKYNNLLNNIQNDFLKDRLSKKKRFLKLNDNSISINICCDKRNEIEVLHEKLLMFFKNEPDISPSDIVVTSFAMNDYISLIHTTFSDIDKKKQIPFYIAKKFSKKTKIILSVFNNLLNLSNSRFENEEILELFDIPEIAYHFKISKEEINILHHWIHEANIRWAVDAKHKKKFLLPQDKQNTWFYGIEKLLLSYAINDIGKNWKNILSCSFINYSRSDLVGKLITFINILNKWQKKLSKSKYLKNWRSLSRELINDFFYKSKRISQCIEMIHKKWTQMIDDSLLSINKKISIVILKKIFTCKNNIINNKKFLPGAVNFCHPSSICFIPFKIIYFIGFDSNNIPKKNNLDNFNLLNKYPVICNFNIYDKYYHLFLQNISCSQKYFYISYVGYSIQDNSKIDTPILIDQLLNYISSYFCFREDKNLTIQENKIKITKHLCKKYTYEHFYKKKDIRNFFTQDSKYTLNNFIIKPKESRCLKKNNVHTIDLIDFVQFWKNPIQYFFKQNLKIYLNLQMKPINTTEPFLIDKLDDFQIKNILLNHFIKNKDIKEIFQYYVLSGKLPHNFFGTVLWNKKINEIKSISNLVTKYRTSTEKKIININIKKYKINGILYEVQKTGLLRWKPNIISYSDRISLWIEHLIYSITGGTGESKIIGYKSQIWSYISLNPNIACSYLEQYIEGYIKGLQKPLFLTKSGASWLDQIYDRKNNFIKNDDDSKRKSYKKLLETWQGNSYVKGEKEDLYIKNIIKVLNKSNIQKICKTAQKWLTPILENKKTKK